VLSPVRIVGLGGSFRPGSTSERAVAAALAESERLGAEVRLLGGADLTLPLYDPANRTGTRRSQRLLAELAAADGVILASPAYHGGISGLMKNALDHVEELRDEERPYLSGRAVGCVSVAAGWQGAVATLGALREVTHALRGWPTPLGITVNSAEQQLRAVEYEADRRCVEQLETVGRQVAEFAHAHARTRPAEVAS
jgi:FMN reductase